MSDTTSPEFVSKVSAETRKFLAEHKVPETPENYQLWYAYVTQSNPDLVVEVDSVLRNNTEFTPSLNKILFDRYFGTGKIIAAYDQANSDFRAEITQVMEHLTQAGGDASRFRESLEGFSSEIDDGVGADSFRDLLCNLMSETRTMAEQSQRLESELHESSRRILDLEKDLETVERESHIDALTGIANRKCFGATFGEAVRNAGEGGPEVSIIMADIDFFNKFNDKWGHQLGDQVLKLVGQTVRTHAGGGNLAARYGGEEFSIVLPGVRLQDAAEIAEKIRDVMVTKRLTNKSTNEPLGSITLSLGVAQYTKGETDAELLKRADIALYAAKEHGRNRVEFSSAL